MYVCMCMYVFVCTTHIVAYPHIEGKLEEIQVVVCSKFSIIAYLIFVNHIINHFFKKIRVTKGTFHANVGTIKDRNGKDLTAVEDIKKEWQ